MLQSLEMESTDRAGIGMGAMVHTLYGRRKPIPRARKVATAKLDRSLDASSGVPRQLAHLPQITIPATEVP